MLLDSLSSLRAALIARDKAVTAGSQTELSKLRCLLHLLMAWHTARTVQSTDHLSCTRKVCHRRGFWRPAL